jgi:hypothetical protein
MDKGKQRKPSKKVEYIVFLLFRKQGKDNKRDEFAVYYLL